MYIVVAFRMYNHTHICDDISLFIFCCRYAFSKRRGVLPTIIPKPDSTVPIGKATQMSTNDIKRVNQLYQCRE